MRRSNLGLVLRHLRDHGPRSRARIAQETGLNKATVSSLVAELTERGLVSAVQLPRGDQATVGELGDETGDGGLVQPGLGGDSGP